MWIKTLLGWRRFWAQAEPPSDSPEYKGNYGPTRNIQDPWADRENRARLEANQRKAKGNV